MTVEYNLKFILSYGTQFNCGAGKNPFIIIIILCIYEQWSSTAFLYATEFIPLFFFFWHMVAFNWVLIIANKIFKKKGEKKVKIP